jgi:hypothetical protein
MTAPQSMLASALGKKGWIPEHVICTNLGYPRNYKVDIGHPETKLAIEVDGRSHQMRERQEQDRKKESILSGLGWTVLRFKNEEVKESLAACVAMVTSTISKLKTLTLTSPTES